MEIKGGRKEKIRGLVCRTIECLKGKGGSGVPMAAAVTLALLVIFCGISEYFRLQIIAVGVRDALEDAIISVVNDAASSATCFSPDLSCYWDSIGQEQ